MQLLSDRVQVEILPEKEVVSKTGLYIAPNPVTGYRENYFRGKVLNTGNGRNVHGNIIPMTVKKGDIVMYPLTEYKLHKDGKHCYHIIYETDIFAILTEDVQVKKGKKK